MQRFEWVNARSEAEAAASGATTVAAAMVVPAGERTSRDAVIVKAGGIDLLDLMKEGLLQPRRIANLRGVAGLDKIVEQKDGTLRVGGSLAYKLPIFETLVRRAILAARQV